MKQVVQSVSGGPVRVIDVPRPTIGPTEVLVRTVVSTISAGTEKAVTALAQSSLLDKARARPDLVRQVIHKARTEGLANTARAVRTRLDDELPLGYSACGLAVEVGEAVAHVRPGMLVATGGGGKANHAEFQAVPGLLCVPVPDGVPAADAAFATLGSIALHGLRLAEVDTGAKLVVVGLGLVGQLTVRLARASGCDVFGIDVDPVAIERVIASGATGSVEAGDDTTVAVTSWARGRGADAVIVAAAGKSSSVMGRVPALCRDGATVVVLGDVGLELDRRPYYDRELAVRFARSYGPGRYERTYEDWGVDYPAGAVRWTEGRNFEAVLDLLASGHLEVADLVTHRFCIDEADAAYALIDGCTEPFVGIQLTYPGGELGAEAPIVTRNRVRSRTSSPGVGLIGAGAFPRTVLLPAFAKAGFNQLVAVSSASGLSARQVAERSGFERAVSGADAVIDDDEVEVVVVASSHETHAGLVSRALRAGKDVFCEKPLSLSEAELDDVEAALAESEGVLFVGFNRRWSRPIALVGDHFARSGGPLVITYRVNAGTVPPDHWYHDRRQGGRLLGEVCHFVDTCAAIVGSPAASVQAVASGEGELALSEDVALLLWYPDGSIATITYAAGGHPSIEKERIDVLGRGHSATVVDFREVVLDGRATTIRPQDKGHIAEVQAFRAMVTSGDRAAAAEAVASTRTTLQAAARLGNPGPR